MTKYIFFIVHNIALNDSPLGRERTISTPCSTHLIPQEPEMLFLSAQDQSDQPYFNPQGQSVQFSLVAQSCPTFWTTARQASPSITNSKSILELTPTESVMPSNHLILCCPLILPPSIFPSIRVFSKSLLQH